MNEVLNAILTRRSVRSYKPDPVPEDVLERILTAGQYAATGMNRQSPIILAVTNKAMRDKLSAMNAEIMGSSGDPFYGAPVVLVGLFALRVLKVDFGSVSGLLCGSMANPMALNYVNDTIEGDNPSVSYATVYPVCMFLRVIIIQVMLMLVL